MWEEFCEAAQEYVTPLGNEPQKSDYVRLADLVMIDAINRYINQKKELTRERQRKMNKFREEIKRGAALLDNKFPGWESKVNVKTLDMSKASLCLIRQVNPYYEVWHTEREILPLQERYC